MYIKHIIPVISYGKHSKVFINYFSERNSNPDLLSYFKILKKKWTLKSEKLVMEIDSALEKCTNQRIYYLLLSNKLSVSGILGDLVSSKQIYEKLKKEFKNIPLAYRKLSSLHVF